MRLNRHTVKLKASSCASYPEPVESATLWCKNKPLMDWDDIRYFLNVSRTGSIRSAASQLGVNHSTVSRRINQLEKKLGVRLFDKLPTGYLITPAGEEIIDYAMQIEEQTNALKRQVFGRDTELSGKLRVTLSEALASHLLMPDIKMFCQTYPGIHIELVISDDQFSLSKREADVAIRVTNGSPPDHLIGRKLLTYAVSTYASQEYLKKENRLSEPENINWLGWDDDIPVPQWIKQSEFPEIPVKHQANHIVVQLIATRSGLGISSLPCFMADTDPQLVRVPDASAQPGRDIWLLTHQDLKQTARVKAFTAFMADAIRAHADLLEGRCYTA